MLQVRDVLNNTNLVECFFKFWLASMEDIIFDLPLWKTLMSIGKWIKLVPLSSSNGRHRQYDRKLFHIPLQFRIINMVSWSISRRDERCLCLKTELSLYVIRMTGSNTTTIQTAHQLTAAYGAMLASPTMLQHSYPIAGPSPVNSYQPMPSAWIPHAAVSGATGQYIMPHPMTTVSIYHLYLSAGCIYIRHPMCFCSFKFTLNTSLVNNWFSEK